LRILVIEDEKKIADFIKRGLKEEGYSVDVAYDGQEGQFLFTTNEYDLIILDIMLPKIDGLTLCRQIRQEKILTPVIMLTAKDTVKDKVTGLYSGADDYLTKPFAFEELLARIRVIFRKATTSATTKLSFQDLTLDLLTHKVMRQGKEIILTNKEYALLEYLMRRPHLSDCSQQMLEFSG
jgi:DNA-binding response OmpR family regulator